MVTARRAVVLGVVAGACAYLMYRSLLWIGVCAADACMEDWS